MSLRDGVKQKFSDNEPEAVLYDKVVFNRLNPWKSLLDKSLLSVQKFLY